MQLQSHNSLEYVYDKYSHILYGIALSISHTEKEAGEILVNTFYKLKNQKLNNSFLCSSLIKMLIQTAFEHLNPKNNFTLIQFENTPLLHKLFCGQDLETHCKENYLTRADVGRKIREEFNLLKEHTPEKKLFKQNEGV